MRGIGIVLAALAALAPAPAQVPARVGGLVARLGHPEFAEREAAATALVAVGESALPALRAALAAEDAEVARRAAGLIVAIARQAEARRLLAPTMVALAAPADAPVTLAQVAAAWQRASGVEFQLASAEAGATRVASRTPAPVTLWAAVELVADELNLDVSARVVTRPGESELRPVVALTPRAAGTSSGPKRFTPHALAVGTVTPPAGVALPKDSLSVILEALAEPKLRFQRLDAVVVTKAVDARGQELRTLPALVRPAPVAPTFRARGLRGGGAIVADADGVALVPAGVPLTNFAPTASQALVRFAVPEAAPDRLALLEGILRTTVCLPREELARVAGIDKKPLAGTAGRGVGLTVQTLMNSGTGGTDMLVVTVTCVPGEIAFRDRPLKPPAETVTNFGGRGNGAWQVSGTAFDSAAGALVVADAAGEPFEVSSQTSTVRPLPDGRVAEQLILRFLPTEKARGAPASVAVSGARTRTLDVPFTLRDVPLHAGPAAPPPTPAAP